MSRQLIQSSVALAEKTSWRIGGAAEYFAEPEHHEDLVESLKWAKENGHSVTVLGGGSNVLISDSGVPGLVLSLKKWSGILKQEGQGSYFNLKVRSGTSKSEILRVLIKEKSSAALFLSGIPGQVGGGVVMNAGVGEAIAPKEFQEIVEAIGVVEFASPEKEKIYSRHDLEWSYRQCRGWGNGVITWVHLRVPYQDDLGIVEKVRSANLLRAQKQPLDLPSCGSVFRNPQGSWAGQLIAACGLKGHAVGGAQVSPKHANFIVNTGKATALDVQRVISEVQKRVKGQLGVTLETEVVRLGEKKWE